MNGKKLAFALHFVASHVCMGNDFKGFIALTLAWLVQNHAVVAQGDCFQFDIVILCVAA
jgi:hypothetical protein